MNKFDQMNEALKRPVDEEGYPVTHPMWLEAQAEIKTLLAKLEAAEAKVVKVSTLLHDLLTQNIPTLQLSLKEADDKLEAVRGLVDKWRSEFVFDVYAQETADDYADELEALMK